MKQIILEGLRRATIHIIAKIAEVVSACLGIFLVAYIIWHWFKDVIEQRLDAAIKVAKHFEEIHTALSVLKAVLFSAI